MNTQSNLGSEDWQLNTQVLEFAELTTGLRKMEADVKRLKENLAAREEKIIEGFSHAGIQNMKLAGGQTVYLNREIYVNLVGDPQKARTALRRAGVGDFIKETVSSQTLRGWVRNDLEDEAIPKGLQPYIEVGEKFRMRMRSNS